MNTPSTNNKSRLMVNLIGIPLLLLSISLGGLIFSIMILLAMIFCLEELHSMLLNKNIKIYRFNFYLFIGFVLLELFKFNLYPFILSPMIILMLFINILIFEFTTDKKVSFINIICNIVALAWIAFSLYFVLKIRLYDEYQSIDSILEFKGGFYLGIIMFVSIWSCDSFAYIFGSKFGKSKLCPSISPKKTWLGAVSGLVLTFTFIYILYLNNYFSFLNTETYKIGISDILILGVTFGVISQIGDLFESGIKRKVNMKDSGTVLQGHGGMLDRLDSLLFVSPVLYLYLKFYIGLTI